MTTFLFFGGIIIALLIWLVISAQSIYKSRMAQAEGTRKSLLSSSEHAIDDVFVYQDGSGIAIDSKNCKIIILSENQKYVYAYNNITYVSLCEDSNTITETNRGSQLTGAVIGGVALGGVGAIIGGLSAAKSSSDLIEKVYLRVGVDDVLNPVHQITFLYHPSGFKKNLNSFTRKLYDEGNTPAVKWYSRLQSIIKKY